LVVLEGDRPSNDLAGRCSVHSTLFDTRETQLLQNGESLFRNPAGAFVAELLGDRAEGVDDGGLGPSADAGEGVVLEPAIVDRGSR
jgi:hypothetical protein